MVCPHSRQGATSTDVSLAIMIREALVISCLGLVYSAYSQSGLGQPRAAHDAAGQRNGMLPPLVDLGPRQTYKGQQGGLYPGGSNVRPAAHDAAGQKIARGIVPLAADGNPDPVNGKVVIMPVSVSNGYGAWHLGDAGDTSTTFMTRANANPAKNPKLFIAYGFEYQLPGGTPGRAFDSRPLFNRFTYIATQCIYGA